MKTNNKIYSFFIALALLFWNPISYFLIYVNTPIFTEKVTHFFYWIYSFMFLSGVLLMYLIQKNRLNEKIKNTILTLAFTGILFSALVFTDSLIGLTLKNEVVQVQKQEGLIFEPNSRAVYQTVEFNYIAKINSLGLRDREIHIEKGEKYRVLCFGDSWTYGWGVNVENSWPKKLEQYLLTNGFENIEVINCGQAGQYTSTYKKNMKKVIPLLEPDLVLVGVLQYDDLAQLYQHNFSINLTNINTITQKIFARIKSVIGTYLKYSFKNSLSLLSNRESKSVEIKSNWKTASTSMIVSFNPSQKFLFQTLDDTVQSLFKSGELNPGLLKSYVGLYDSRYIYNNQNHPATQFAIQEMNKDFKEMRDICHKYGSNLIFINLPTSGSTGHIVIRTPLSDVLNGYFEKNNKVDSVYRSIANANNVSYMELTDYFISLQNKSDYFFRYDGHPNKNGYEEIAKYIGKQLIEQNMLDKE